MSWKEVIVMGRKKMDFDKEVKSENGLANSMNVFTIVQSAKNVSHN